MSNVLKQRAQVTKIRSFTMTQILSVKRARIKGFVYFMETIGASFIKIGWAIDPLERLKDLQIGCPYELRLITVIPNKFRRVEHRLQNKFKSLCVRSEWFKYQTD